MKKGFLRNQTRILIIKSRKDCEIILQNADEIGKAFKLISERLKNYIPHEISKEEQEKINSCHDCLKCKNYTRREAYDQSNGMILFYNNSCDKHHSGKINSYFYGIKCEDFEKGDNTLVYMSDKEKEQLGVYHISIK